MIHKTLSHFLNRINFRITHKLIILFSLYLNKMARHTQFSRRGKGLGSF
uniref:Uncharacterized protein n=1 Tax=Meloidogyne enterolobii TaxID=390850 RepID=A0A6V7XRK7_MELEN|nr:unnamed protein product [Meloidogyne enterolobii]